MKSILKAKELDLQQRNDEKEFNNKRLESLLKISQYTTNSTEELVSKALDEAIELTKSKIGYIYFYNESNKIFTLNAWSETAMEECKVTKKQTSYKLDNTGIWGEAVRQRKPIVINDFKASNSNKKGLPKGHVELYNFLTIPVFYNNEIVAVVGVANKSSDYDKSDITQLQLLMDNVWRIKDKIKLISDLEVALKKAEESDTLKTAFLQNLSHEIRTPMNGILGFCDLIKQPGITQPKLEYYLDIISDSSKQLLTIVTDILTISSLETKQERLKEEMVDINALTSNLFDIYFIKAKEKGLSLNFNNGLEDTDGIIVADRSKLTQILNNLLSNAIKFTETGSITYGYTIKNEEIEFYVQDTGIGIDESNHIAIFKHFRQAETDLCRNYGGNGLGLSISKGFVELFGGNIWVKSVPQKGSIFYFTIPYNPIKEFKNAHNKPISLNKKLKILIAEDENTNFMYLKLLLSKYSIEILRAKTGKEAVYICESDPQIDVVLMDIKMPDMDGITATKIIKKHRKDLRIIAQTAYALDSEIMKNEKVFDGYLTKPIDKDKLFNLLEISK